MDTIIIAVIIAACLGFAIYKIFVRPSCSCGCGGKKSLWSCHKPPMEGDSDDKAVSDGKGGS
jgi:hypothetical protein